MIGSSRHSMLRVNEALDGLFDDASMRSKFKESGDGVLAIVDAMTRERSLRQFFADNSISAEAKAQALQDLIGDKIPDQARDLVALVVSQRWSSESDLVDAVERVAIGLELMHAEQEGSLGNVEDEIFRFGRAVDSNPELQMALTDPATGPDVKAGIVRTLLEGKSDSTTSDLVAFVASHLRGRRLHAGVKTLSEMAAHRRGRELAVVRSATLLTEQQQERLAQALTNLRGKPVQLNIEVDPSIVGGLQVRVGEEVIDGSLSTRIDQARRRLAG